MLGIDKEKREHAIRLLQCLAFSRRPLRAKELAEVLSIQFDTAIPRLNTSFRPGDADEAVLSACSTLVSIIKPDGPTLHDLTSERLHKLDDVRVVQFSHYSVKEFLTSERLRKLDNGDLYQFYISPESAHTVLARTCVSILLEPGLHDGDTTDDFPLAEYAARNWFHHAQCDSVASQIQDGMECLFDSERKHFATWISIHDLDRPWSKFFGLSTRTKANPLYYAVLCGVGSLVEHLVSMRQQDPNENRGSQGTPLQVAVALGHTTITRILLESTNVNTRDMDIATLLHVAVRNRNFDLTQLLLNHGANVNAFGHQGVSPLHEAVHSQNLDVVELLLKGGADVNARSWFNQSPLHLAASRGNLDITRLLLNHGADVNARSWLGSWFNQSPLHEAASRGNFDITQLLLNHGADVNVLDHQGVSPLHRAVRSQNLDVVKLLLKVGADVNARSWFNQSPLHEAAGGGNLDIMRLLLRYGADVNVLNHQGVSPLYKVMKHAGMAMCVI